MVTLEQIKLLESKISRAVSFVEQLTEDKIRLEKTNKELEETISRLRDERNKVEEGIVSALGKLNQFEDAIERSISNVRNKPETPAAAPAAPLRPKPAAPAAPSIPSVPPAAVVQPAHGLASIYTEDEDAEEQADEEELGEAELDIF